MAKHGNDSGGIWAEYPKGKAQGFGWDALVEECLSFGWIDSTPKKVDADFTSTYIAPRNPKSGWSRRNKELVEKLRTAGLMQESGEAAIKIAQQNGSWELFDLAEDLVFPEKLELQFNLHPEAREGFLNYPARTQKAVLQWLYSAKREDTLDARIEKVLKATQSGQRLAGF